MRRDDFTFPASATKYDVVQLGGGLDQLTPILRLRSGYVRDALNFEQAVTGGYARINGYERFDGRVAPSSATYLTITVTVSGALVVGNAINGQTSGATGTIISLTSDGAGHQIVAYTLSTGSFQAGENVRTGVTVQGTVFALGGAGTAADYDVTQRSLAANVYRALILVPVGSGPIRGGVTLAGVTYCWRDNAGATAANIWKATGAGWVQVAMLNEVSFTAGSVSPVVGNTVTQGANSATVRQVCLESGAWAGGTAAGRLIVTTPAPGNFAAGALTAGGTLTLSGAQTAITILPGGRVQMDLGNFGGVVRAYGCDAVNRGFEFDGTTYAPIKTTYVPDVPTNVQIHKDCVWFSSGAVFGNSNINNPFGWTAVGGSVQFRCDGTITTMLKQPGSQAGGAMSVTTQTSTDMLYGSSSTDFQRVSFEQSTGCRQYGAQRIGGQTVVFSDAGVFTLSATQAFGNFTPASLTMNIRPFTQVRRNQVTGVLVNREKSQYRVFFNDTFGLYCTLVNGRLMGAMPVQFPNKVACCWAGTSPDGTEVSYFGSDNGMVYALDQGTSHDGAAIMAYATLAFANQGNSRVLKRYTGAAFEVQGESYCTFDVTYEVGYGGLDRAQGSGATTAIVNLSPVYWDSFVWDSFTWDGKTLAPTDVRINGTGENIALRIDSASDKFSSFTLNSVILHYRVRKALKA